MQRECMVLHRAPEDAGALALPEASATARPLARWPGRRRRLRVEDRNSSPIARTERQRDG